MALIKVTIEGNDISNDVLRYTRTQQICTGVGKFDFSVTKEVASSIYPWDKVTLYENDTKKGIYYVVSKEESAGEGNIIIETQDSSKKLMDYFIHKTYYSKALGNAKEWLKKFLNLAKVDYKFVSPGIGAPVGINSSFGMDTAYNTIQSLLQQSGWYLYFNSNAKAIIGQFIKNPEDYDEKITDADLFHLELHKDDERLRNRAVVWGNADPISGAQIFTDVSRHTPWNIDKKDKRAVVLSNSYIRDKGTANELAVKLLNEFAHIKYTKHMRMANDHNLQLGDLVLVDSERWSGIGQVTTVGAEFTPAGGLIQIATLDETCPRLFAYFSYWDVGYPIYVYIGTEGSGIWKRLTDSVTWTDVSSGLENLHIKDLFIRDGVYATVAGDGYLYTKTLATNYWSKYEHPPLMDISGKEYQAGTISGVACSINNVGNIVAGYNYVPSGTTISGNRAWVLELTPYHQLIRAELVTVAGEVNKSIVDLEAAEEYNIVSTSGFLPSGVNPLYYGLSVDGTRDVRGRFANGLAWNSHAHTNLADEDAEFVGRPDEGGASHSAFVQSFSAGATYDSMIIDDNDIMWSHGGTVGSTTWRVGWGDLNNNLSSGNYLFTRPAGITTPSWWTTSDPAFSFIRKKTSSIFDILFIFEYRNPGNSNDVRYDWHHVNWTIGSSTSTLLRSGTIQDTINGSGFEHLDPIGWNSSGRYISFGYIIPEGSVQHFEGFTYNFDAQVETDYSIASIETAKVGDTQYQILGPQQIDHGNGASYVLYYMKIGYSGAYVASLDTILAAYFIVDENQVTYTSNKIVRNPNHTATSVSLQVDNPPHVGSSCSYGTRFGNGYDLLEYWFQNGSTKYGYLLTIQHPGVIEVKSSYSGAITSQKFYDRYGKWMKTLNCSYSPGLQNEDSQTGYNSRFLFPLMLSYSYDTDEATPPEYINFINLLSHECVGRVRADSTYYLYNNLLSSSTKNVDDVYDTIYIMGNTTGVNPNRAALGFGVGGKLKNTISNMTGGTEFITSHNHIIMKDGIAAWRAHWLYYTYETPLAGLKPPEILKHTSTTEITGSVANIDAQEQTQGVFELLHYPPYGCKVEISKLTPTVIYKEPVKGEHDGYLASSITNEVNSFVLPSEHIKVYDVRVIDLTDPNTYTLYSGILPDLVYESYIMVCNEDGIFLTKYDLTGNWFRLVTASGVTSSGTVISGIIHRIEATNYTYPNPFIFYSISGKRVFMQRNPDSAYFTSYSTTLPLSPITIIRTDDIL